jgi:hypothetical protein
MMYAPARLPARDAESSEYNSATSDAEPARNPLSSNRSCSTNSSRSLPASCGSARASSMSQISLSSGERSSPWSRHSLIRRQVGESGGGVFGGLNRRRPCYFRGVICPFP